MAVESSCCWLLSRQADCDQPDPLRSERSCDLVELLMHMSRVTSWRACSTGVMGSARKSENGRRLCSRECSYLSTISCAAGVSSLLTC